MSIELTNVCNFSCPLCPQAWERADTPAGAPYDRPHGVMAPEVFARAHVECNRVADTVELGFFGEQTLHPRYLEYIRALGEREFQLEFNTNLSYVTREMMDAWVEIGAEQVRLSLDAASPELFDELRPGRVRLGTPRPCRTCRDGNNWERNEVVEPREAAAPTRTPPAW